jgi:hypothetical protein
MRVVLFARIGNRGGPWVFGIGGWRVFWEPDGSGRILTCLLFPWVRSFVAVEELFVVAGTAGDGGTMQRLHWRRPDLGGICGLALADRMLAFKVLVVCIPSSSRVGEGVVMRKVGLLRAFWAVP